MAIFKTVRSTAHQGQMLATTAQAIADRYGMDGQCWEDPQGTNIADACRLETRGERHDGHGMDRFVFADDSVLTLAEGGWDFGYVDCWCWQGAGHSDGCEARS